MKESVCLIYRCNVCEYVCACVCVCGGDGSQRARRDAGSCDCSHASHVHVCVWVRVGQRKTDRERVYETVRVFGL